MDPRLLQYYNLELQHLRETGAEFAEQFPKIAARLGMHGLEVDDPYVERLLEGVGFLAARVQLKLEAEFPRFTQALLEIVYPHYLAPTPSMLIAQFTPDPNDPNLAGGFRVARGATLSGLLAADDATACEFRTAHDVTLWPVEIVSASYFSFAPDLPLNTLPIAQRIKGGVRIRLKTTAGLTFAQTAIDRLCFYLTGRDDVANKLYELCLASGLGALVLPVKSATRWHEFVPAGGDPAGRLQRRRGAAAGDAALVSGLPAAAGVFRVSATVSVFRGDRARAGPETRRFEPARARDSARARRADPRERRRCVEPGAVLHAGPQSVRQARRPHPCQRQRARVPRRAGPDQAARFRSLCRHRALSATASGRTANSSFLPFYSAYSSDEEHQQSAYFTTRREPRLVSLAAKRRGPRSSYIGTEVFLSLVDPAQAPFSGDLRQLSIETLCTNRDLVAADAERHRRHRLVAGCRRPRAEHPCDQRSQPSVRASGRRPRVLARDQPSVAQLSVARADDAGGRGGRTARSARAVRGQRRPYGQAADRGHQVGARGTHRAPAACARSARLRPRPRDHRAASTSWRSRAPARSCSDRCSIDISHVTCRSTRSRKRCCGPSNRGEINRWGQQWGARPTL